MMSETETKKTVDKIIQVCGQDIKDYVRATASIFFDIRGVKDVLLCSLVSGCIHELMRKGKIILVRKD